MKRLRPSKLTFFVCLTAIIASTAIASAQLRLVPQIVRPTLMPGQTQTVRIAVQNVTDTTRTLTSRVDNMTLSPQGLPRRAGEDAPRGCREWLTVTPESANVPPGTSEVFECTLSPPRTASGGYYAMVSFGTRFQEPEQQPEGEGSAAMIGLSSSISAVFLVTVRGRDISVGAEAQGVALGVPSDEERAGTGKQWKAAVDVVNTGNMHAIMEGTLSILSEDGRTELDTCSLRSGQGYVLPGMTRRFTGAGEYNLPDAAYLALSRIGPTHAPKSSWARRITPFYIEDGEMKPGEPTEEMRKTAELLGARVMVKPARITFDVPPGGRRTKPIDLRNPSDKPITLEPEIDDWAMTPEGEIQVAENLQGDRSMPEIVQMPRRIRVPARGHRTVPVAVQMPRNAVGDYYPAVVFRAVIDGEKQPQDATYLPSTMLMCSVTNTGERELQVESAEVIRQSDGGVVFDLVASNTGNATINASASVRVIGPDGSEVAGPLQLGSSTFQLLAGGSRHLEATWYGRQSEGEHTANFSISSGSGESAGKRATFEIPAGDETDDKAENDEL
ncbi:MAG: hypothetical protein ACLFWB_12185 [Armatimonadota bacterium]